MIEGRAARRILKQTEKARTNLVETANPSVLDADNIARQHLDHGFVVIPAGTRVIVDTTVDHLRRRQKSPILGGFTLEADVEAEIYLWDKKRVNSSAPFDSATLELGLTSPKRRDLDKEYDEVGARLMELESGKTDLSDTARANAISTWETIWFAVQHEITAEITRASQELLKKNPKISDLLYSTPVYPERVSEILLQVGTNRHVELPWT